MTEYDEVEKKLIKARIQLLEHYPFFGYLGMFLKFHRDNEKQVVDETEPVGVDQEGNLYYYPLWINEISFEEVIATLAHEILHIVLEHIKRGEKRTDMVVDPRTGKQTSLWNICADMVVNEIVEGNGMKVGRDCVRCPGEFRNLVAEEIYEKLRKKMKEIISPISYGKSNDKMIQSKSKEGETKQEQMEEVKRDIRFWREKVAEASAFAKSKGKLPYGLEKLLDWILGQKKLTWRNILLRIIEESIVSDFTLVKPSKKSWVVGFYVPNVKRENLKVWIALDTSGSISDEQYNEFLNEVFGLLESFENVEAKVWLCDADVQKEVTGMDKWEIMEEIVKRKGYGGTDFRPVFKKAEEDRAKILIFFTDLWGDFPEEETVKTIWVRSGSTLEPPFGILVDLDGGEMNV